MTPCHKLTVAGKCSGRGFLSALLLLTAAVAAVDEASLKIFVSDKQDAQYSVGTLKAKLKSRDVSLYDPFHAKVKRYECFPLKELLDFAYGAKWRDPAYSDVAFHALDGYEAVASTARLAEDGACLAFRDRDGPDWEPIGHKKANPGPFYLFWTGTEQTTANGYPWPWQVEALRLLRFEDQYAEVLPKGAAKDSPASRGFKTFKEQCLRCHSINQQGGKIGPDLNAPRSVVTYHAKDFLKDFIRQPSKYRYGGMPDHTHLSDRDLDDILAYLELKSKQP